MNNRLSTHSSIELIYHNDPFIKPFEGLRGIAILLVLIYHLFPYIPIAGIGWTGVDLFFVLSGFLITRILLETKNKPKYFQRFYTKRALRIFPLYYLFIIVCVIINHLIPLNGLKLLPENILYVLTYTLNFQFYDINGLVPGFAMNHFWSLAIEEHFYLIWPLMVWLMNKRLLLPLSFALFFFSSLCAF